MSWNSGPLSNFPKVSRYYKKRLTKLAFRNLQRSEIRMQRKMQISLQEKASEWGAKARRLSAVLHRENEKVEGEEEERVKVNLLIQDSPVPPFSSSPCTCSASASSFCTCSLSLSSPISAPSAIWTSISCPLCIPMSTRQKGSGILFPSLKSSKS